MTQLQRIEKSKALVNLNRVYSYADNPAEAFRADAKRYIKAIKEGRMICSIEHVSSSGMTRHLKFIECSKGTGRYHFCNFYQFFKALGYAEAKDTGAFKIYGCGMDMVFNTNYNNIHTLRRLGLIQKDTAANLAQKTPHVI